MWKHWCHIFRKFCQELLEILSSLAFVFVVAVSYGCMSLCLKLPYCICLCQEVTLFHCGEIEVWTSERGFYGLIRKVSSEVSEQKKTEQIFECYFFFVLTQQQWPSLTTHRNPSDWKVNQELILGKYFRLVCQVSGLFCQNKIQK